MRIEPFEMERYQSAWENRVDCNLSESGVEPLRPSELLGEEGWQRLGSLKLGYPQTNGTVELRSCIAELYPGAGPDRVLVTTGTAEANLIATLLSLEAGDEVVFMMPNYMQVWGLARSLGATVKPFWLKEGEGWAADLEALRGAVSSRTRLIAVCNPNNPTGAVLSETGMEAVVDCAKSAAAWLLADEVYRGAELDGSVTSGFWGRYERTIVTGGLSKAYGLPGLRIGWLVSTPELIARAWAWKDYSSISPGALSDFLARAALASRERLRARTASILKHNYPILRSWVDHHGERFSLVDPRCGAIAYLRYRWGEPSVQLAENLRLRHSVLVVPGAHFQMGDYLRIGFGYRPEALEEALARISLYLAQSA